MAEIRTVLVIGGSGSVGRVVVDELTRRGASVRVLVREGSKGGFPATTDVRVGDITDPVAFDGVLDGVDAVVFTHGANGTPKQNEAVDYGVVRNLLAARNGELRISLMTTVGVTDHTIGYNQTSQVCDWKRRAERLVRASGLPYTIVRPGWFDYNADDEHQVVFRQGDQFTSGDATDGVVARQQIAEVLVDALYNDAATWKTLELVAEKGPVRADLTDSFGALDADVAGSVNGSHDRETLPLADEPERVLADLDAIRRPRA